MRSVPFKKGRSQPGSPFYYFPRRSTFQDFLRIPDDYPEATPFGYFTKGVCYTHSFTGGTP